MSSSLRKREWIIPLLFAIALAATVLVGTNVWGGSTADAQGAADPSDLINADGFTGPGDEANWPPRPTGGQGELTPLQHTIFFDSLDLVTPASSIVSRPAVAAEVGNDWNHLSTASIDGGKGSNDIGTEHVFFSRDKNQTVVVIDFHTGETEMTTFAPTEWQPVFSAEELAEAVEIAKAHLIAKGNTEVADMFGHGIRIFTEDGNYHPVRMVATSLAEDSFAYPDYLVKVDLTNRVVVEDGTD